MHAYVVTGQIGYCIYGQWQEIGTSEEVRAANADDARDRILARHQPVARRQDPFATVVWKERPRVQRVKALEWAA